ncbi:MULTISPECIES: 3-dehydroquinate synthase [Vagococcus]|uniref:3-dehydroquinate synthase n=1 Tax=Vagococcus fluvialis bH819 TaxID=1255619 RepID=A0A1X6WNV5_9ENTE|nr:MULTISPECIES: 3-dehydroquinate synthase [Vagococcus]SLM85912.1 3-dehydroquinate synthase [Vagococcus fluvialis bH819]HCM88279.1 3-dehydroquinate synthase [Vagococcus sp.]
MKLSVTLPNKNYDLLIEKGGLTHVGTWVKSLWKPQQIVIISDDNVENLYGEQVEKAIREAGFEVSLIAVKPGETSKNLATAEKIYHYLAECGMTRKDGVIILGGGVVGDLGAFVASTYMRGIHFLQIPTTLLAQVDSSIGGKTAVNTSVAKNLVGTFAQPDGVLIDPNTLLTLEDRRLQEGMAEVVKAAAVADKELWDLLSTIKDEKDILNYSEEIIFACCKVKRNVVEEDEFDTGIRLILNFGHTIGHAIEQTQGFGVITHGEAVAIGMCQLTKNAEKLGTMPSGLLNELESMLTKFHLPIHLEEWEEDKLFEALTHDKKTRGDSIHIILLEKIGKAKIETISIEEMKNYLEK